MTLQELENQILALPPTEKAAIIQSLTQSINIGAIYLELILDCSLIPTSRLTLKCKATQVDWNMRVSLLQ
jgi:hypothetical protein